MVDILGISRTPICALLGSLSKTSAAKLGAVSLMKAIGMSFIKSDSIDNLVLSQVFSAGCGPLISKQIALWAGLDRLNTFQVNQQCTSGLKATVLAFDAINSGKSQLTAVVGAESSSLAPYLLRKARYGGYGFGDGTLVDTLSRDGPRDIQEEMENLAKSSNISKFEQDQYVLESFKRAACCYSEGIMKHEIAPITVKTEQPSKGTKAWIQHKDCTISEDSFLRFVDFKNSKVDNNAKHSDGAASLIISTENFTRRANLSPVARILDYRQVSGTFPESICDAIQGVKTTINNPEKSVDLYDIMDQNAVVPLYISKRMDIDLSRMNICGSTIALGHPPGMTGVRQIISLVTALKSRGLQFGIAAGSNTHGEATAILVESCT
ncbi:acetyl-CoA acetyltransferase, putative [Theileria equi strain WA]|uniref:Acetyl-CoA acetyltransferase, putative n=1 Tax=Theileria equi strain WA TaxID=1537102 RepID=L0B005_THEEQ|nr:acetyl-CoA acetyltransferase, putative [Theileria equi strain WA]AFZ80838.1 acetyl-CoA acetyltransferase, putative [Theileria equi strain WA]|eukprot:XP_004830504.1 acetyl-CoA acetyltransferase, putative [Theileria equi strain WA]